MKIEIRTCTINDIAQIIDIGVETFKDTYSAGHTAEDIDMYLTEHYTTEIIRKEIEDGNIYYFFAASEECEALGFMKITVNNELAELNRKSGLQINRIYVKRTHKGKSIGKMLLNEAIELAGSLNLACVWLGVWEHNLSALNFYEKLGFVKVGTTTFKFGSTTDTDTYMMLEI